MSGQIFYSDRGARFELVNPWSIDGVNDELRSSALFIRDLGPWDRQRTVTNDAVNVVQRLIDGGFLPSGRRLFYYDSGGQLDELLIKDGRFAGFALGPSR